MSITFSRRSIFTFFGTLLATIAVLNCTLLQPAYAADPAPAFDEKVVYHVDDPALVRMTLANAANHLQVSPKAKISILANGKAISMMTPGEHSAAIADLQAKGVRFLACHNSMNAFGIEESKLVPGAVVVPSGVAELSRLQGAEHYSYIKP
ncbi:MAG TPA: DsrE family protein [Burkholderiaceae bacterium]|jgi:hypothetical protein